MSAHARFKNVTLCGGFTIVRVEVSEERIVDALGREAIARTAIIGRKFQIQVRAGLSEKEFSVTLYHEAHEQWGFATPQNLNRMLQSYGFRTQ
jgi:hypothetical protein